MKLLPVLGVGAILIACSSSASSGAPTCDSLASEARADIQAAIEANSSCMSDTECTSIEFSADCFDSCTRAAASSGKSAIDAARAHANANSCVTFKQMGCKVTIPPCAPSQGSTCNNAGTCQ